MCRSFNFLSQLFSYFFFLNLHPTFACYFFLLSHPMSPYPFYFFLLFHPTPPYFFSLEAGSAEAKKKHLNYSVEVHRKTMFQIYGTLLYVLPYPRKWLLREKFWLFLASCLNLVAFSKIKLVSTSNESIECNEQNLEEKR